jgi:glycerol transport system substrate-binding protein
VPVNWSAYEDIAEFFTNDVKEIDGKKVYGHMDYGKKDPVARLAFHRCLAVDGRQRRQGHPERQAGRRVGHPHGWLRPVGSASSAAATPTARLRSTRSTKYLEWLKKYAPPNAAGMTFGESGPVPAQGDDRPADLLVHRLHRRHGQARPAGGERRRHAEVAYGAVAEGLLLEVDGMKLGYQDAGSWTLLKSTPVDRRKAAWLYAQFVVSKTVRPEEEPCRPDLHPRERPSATRASPSAPRSSAV